MSEVFKTDQGFHIIRLNNIYDDTYITLRNWATELKKQEYYKNWVEELRKKLHHRNQRLTDLSTMCENDVKNCGKNNSQKH